MSTREWKWGLVSLSLAVAVVASLGCNSGAKQIEAGEGRWEPVSLSVPSGHRMTAYDIDRDVLWILSADYTTTSDAVLTEFHPGTRESRRYTISGSSNWLGYGDAVAVDGEGRVWAAWGDRLIRFDPATEEVKEWAIPAAEGASPDDATDVGVAIDIAMDAAGMALVARNGLAAVSVLDPESGVWRSVPTGEVNAAFVSQLAILSDGTVLLNGLQSESEWAIASLDRTKGEVEVIPADALAYAVLEDGSLVYLDSSTGEMKRRVGTDQESVNVGPTFATPTLENGLTIGPDGSIWLRHDSELRKDVAKVDPESGEASLFRYPLEIRYLGKDIIPAGYLGDADEETPLVLDPGIQGMVVDKRGDVWVITDSDGESASYPPLYRLDPDA